MMVLLPEPEGPTRATVVPGGVEGEGGGGVRGWCERGGGAGRGESRGVRGGKRMVV